jgi:hypothetical protein
MALLGTLSALGLGLAACGEVPGSMGPEASGEQSEPIILPSVVKDPVLQPGPLPGCADGTVEQSFAAGIVGCAGAVTCRRSLRRHD